MLHVITKYCNNEHLWLKYSDSKEIPYIVATKVIFCRADLVHTFIKR